MNAQSPSELVEALQEIIEDQKLTQRKNYCVAGAGVVVSLVTAFNSICSASQDNFGIAIVYGVVAALAARISFPYFQAREGANDNILSANELIAEIKETFEI